MSQALAQITGLVARFEQNTDLYKAQPYNETQVRREFIDPFFEALGWDVANKSGYAEAYKDVIHEDAIKVGGATKAPDYCFRIGGARKFFLEAKKPSVDIRHDVHPAFQLRRYAWSAKLPLSILTDFEETAVYDCRVKPAQTDAASTARVMYIRYTEYPQRWEEIAAIFSREAVLKGSFDKYAESAKRKKGTAQVDDAFLSEIESWRDELAHNIALRNSGLSNRDLNFAVQMTIDRIIFLRICEDRGVESYGELMALLNGDDTYQRLLALFRKADDRYNSGLFHFTKEKDRPEDPDELTPGLTIDDKVLKDIFRRLYYPDSPYEFSVLPAEILGQVYEQFLGKVITLTAGHRARVEEKPEVKKAGGVYYTPTYIVDYIVKNTVGKLLEKKTPAQANRLRILDPACGSGSFLLGAYQYLLDWHLKWYLAHDPASWAKKKNPPICQTTQAGGLKNNHSYKLTLDCRKRILLNNIFGVDIDTQAVEVTKLSLLLRVLEGEKQLVLFHRERALPDLGQNIKCGNSLIGPDFYEKRQGELFDEEEIYRINAFDWKKEFAEVFKCSKKATEGTENTEKSGGFDAVIGNPPYTYMISNEQKIYFENHYKYQDYQKDLYLLFLERYYDLLMRKGLLGIIVSNTWMLSITYRSIRKYMTTHYCWHRILHLPEKIFKAVIDTHVLIFEKARHTEASSPGILTVDIRKKGEINKWHELPCEAIPNNGDPINVVVPMASVGLFHKLQKTSLPLCKFCDVYNGVKPFEKGKGIPPQTEKTMQEKPFVKEGPCPGEKWSPLLRGSLINRYRTLWDNDYWILYGPRLAAPRDFKIFEAPQKIMIRQTGDSLIATIVKSGFIARNNLHILIAKKSEYDLRYFLGIINSKLMDFVYTIMNPEKGEALAEVKKNHVENLPVANMVFSNSKDKSLHDKLVLLVEKMLELNKKLAAAKTPEEKNVLQRQIDTTDGQIDRLVYELYGLTEEEIGMVEGIS